MKPIHMIVAVDLDNGFSKDNKIPWNIKKDFSHFRKITTTAPPGLYNAIIMGRVTFEQIEKPLPNRHNIVITGKIEDINDIYTENLTALYSINDALVFCEENDKIHQIFMIGGERIYKDSIKNYPIKYIYRTIINNRYQCDRFFPEINETFKLINESEEEENKISFKFQCWENLNFTMSK